MCPQANRQTGNAIPLNSQPMKMLTELLTFCCSPMQNTFSAVARQNRLHKEMKGRDGEIEQDRELKGRGGRSGRMYVLGCESRCYSGLQVISPR